MTRKLSGSRACEAISGAAESVGAPKLDWLRELDWLDELVAAFAFAAALRRLCAFVSANANVAAGVVPAVAVAAASEYALNKAAKNASFIIGEQKILGAAVRNLL